MVAILALASLGGLLLAWPGAVCAQSTSTTSSTSSTSSTSTSSSTSSSTTSTLPCALGCENDLATSLEKRAGVVVECHDLLAQWTVGRNRLARRCAKKKPGPGKERCLQKLQARTCDDLKCMEQCEDLAVQNADLSAIFSSSCPGQPGQDRCPSHVKAAQADLIALADSLANDLQGFDGRAYCSVTTPIPGLNAPDITCPASQCRRNIALVASRGRMLRCGHDVTTLFPSIVNQRIDCVTKSASDSFNGVTSTASCTAAIAAPRRRHCPACRGDVANEGQAKVLDTVDKALAMIYAPCWDAGAGEISCPGGDPCNRARCDGTACGVVAANDGTACPEENPANACTTDVCRGGVCAHDNKADQTACGGTDQCAVCVNGTSGVAACTPAARSCKPDCHCDAASGCVPDPGRNVTCQ